jgi:hypothetical protein
MKFLFCAACLCSAGVFARTAMTQETTVEPDGLTVDSGIPIDERVKPPSEIRRDLFDPRPDERTFIGNSAARRPDSAPPGTPPIHDGAPFRSVFSPGQKNDTSGSNSVPMRPITVLRTVTEVIYVPIPVEELQAMQKLQAAIQALKTGKDEVARKAAADVIQQQLTAQFETDLKQREKELAEVEQRVKTLREQLDKRKAAQADIINLRLQTLVNDANGLGFPDTNFGSNAQNDPRQFTNDYDIGLPGPRQSDLSPTMFDPIRPDPRSRAKQTEPDKLELFPPDERDFGPDSP